MFSKEIILNKNAGTRGQVDKLRSQEVRGKKTPVRLSTRASFGEMVTECSEIVGPSL
jgi:hypothetical protein